jgi:acetyl esterase/lipase
MDRTRRTGIILAALIVAGCVTHPDRSTQPYSMQPTVAYTSTMHGDLYLPEGGGPYPAVVVVHGGGWDSRDRSDMDSISRKLARRGYVALNIDYRLAPQFLYPAAVDDVRAAIRWLRTNAERLQIDPDRIGGWGYSAGAHLVALAGATSPDEASRLQAVVAGGTPADLPHYPVSPIISKFIGGTYQEARESWIEASPAAQVSARSAPMFLYHGTWDRLVYVEDAHTMKAALDRAGVPAELYLVRGGGHITTFLFGFGAERAGLDFLDRTLRRD